MADDQKVYYLHVTLYIPAISSSWLLRLISSELESSEQKGRILQLVPGIYSVWDLKSMPVGHGGSSGSATILVFWVETSNNPGSNAILQFDPGTYSVSLLKSIPLGHGGSGIQVTPGVEKNTYKIFCTCNIYVPFKWNFCSKM